jgi:hypothetical protein
MSGLVKVELDGETFQFLARLPFRAVATIRYNVGTARQEAGEDLSPGEVMAVLSEGYLLFGLAKWSLKTPINRPAIREQVLDNPERGPVLSDRADAIYSEQVLLPLVKLAGRLSPSTQTNGSISPTMDSLPSPRKRSKRSLTSTSLTDSTEAITAAPVGGSSS